MIKSFVIAMSMYSKIPMPHVSWDEKSMKYAMCFFPVVGAVIGLCMNGLSHLFASCAIGPLFCGVCCSLLPLLISGGIHMDGFMDTTDALASYADREKKLEILKDSHAGAFAILGAMCYLLLSVAVFSEMPRKMFPLAGGVYVLSRALSGLNAVTLPAARANGSLKSFQDGAHKRVTIAAMCGYVAAALGWMARLDVRTAVVVGVIAAGVCFYYRRLCMKQFGGVTGDLAGYFLEVSELAMLFGIMMCGGGLWS